MPVIRRRLRRRHAGDEARPGDTEVIEIESGELTDVFAAPGWLRDVGLTAWLLVGVALVLVGAVWLLTLTETIVTPVLAAAVVAAVASPLVAWLSRHRLPRALAAALVLIAIVVIGVLVFFLVVAGITSQTGDLGAHLSEAKDTIVRWLKDLGVDPGTAKSAGKDASSSISDVVKALLGGLGKGIKKLSSLVFFLS